MFSHAKEKNYQKQPQKNVIVLSIVIQKDFKKIVLKRKFLEINKSNQHREFLGYNRTLQHSEFRKQFPCQFFSQNSHTLEKTLDPPSLTLSANWKKNANMLASKIQQKNYWTISCQNSRLDLQKHKTATKNFQKTTNKLMAQRERT